MKIAVPREIHPAERRVAATPDTVKRLLKLGFEVYIGAGAGAGSAISDADYEAAGAHIVSDQVQLWREADIVLKVRPPELDADLGRHEAVHDRRYSNDATVSARELSGRRPSSSRVAPRRSSGSTSRTYPMISCCWARDVP